jgi:hypothetical protein
MATAPQNAQLRVRKSFVRSSCPLYRHHAVTIAVNQEGWRGYFAQAVREIGFQPAPPHLALAKRAERSTGCGLVQKATGFIDEFVAHHPRVANHSTQPGTQRGPAPALERVDQIRSQRSMHEEVPEPSVRDILAKPVACYQD